MLHLVIGNRRPPFDCENSPRFGRCRCPGASPAGRARSLGVALALALALVGCGARAPKLQPPAMRISELHLDAAGKIDVRLRVRNPVATTLPADQLEFSIRLDEYDLGSFRPDFDLDIPALGNEVIQITTESRQEISDLLRRLEARELARVSYLIEGELILRESQSTLAVSSRGWLSPTPGKPGSFR